jgi:hypothetical protein
MEGNMFTNSQLKSITLKSYKDMANAGDAAYGAMQCHLKGQYVSSQKIWENVINR